MTDYMRRAPILDGRLSTAMLLAGDTKRFADIGADHGRLSTVMLLADPERRALVSDISVLALSKAQARIGRMGLSDRAVFAVADGLDALSSWDCVPDTILILGMGGDTVSSILLRGQDKLCDASLVLGAQTELPLVREALCTIGYQIVREAIATENRRDYVIIRAEKASSPVAYSEEEILLGPVLIRERPNGWLPVLLRRKRLLSQGIAAMEATQLSKDSERCQAFRRELAYVLNALSYFPQPERTDDA